MNPLRTNKIASLLLMLSLALSSLYIPLPQAAAANATIACTDTTPDDSVCDEDAADVNTALGDADAGETVQLTNTGDKYVFDAQISVTGDSNAAVTLDCNGATIETDQANAFLIGAGSTIRECNIVMTAEQTAITTNGASTTITGNTVNGYDDAWGVNNASNSTTISSNTFAAASGASHYKGITSAGTGAVITSNTFTGNITKGIELSGGSSVLKSNSITSGLAKGTGAGQAHTGIAITGGSAAHVLGDTTGHNEGNTVNTFNTGISIAAEAEIEASDIDNCTTGILHNTTGTVDLHSNNIATATTGISITNTGAFSSHTDTISIATTGININAAVTSDIDNLTSATTNAKGINIVTHTSTAVDGSTFNLDDDSSGIVIAAVANTLTLTTNKFLDDGDGTKDEIAIDNNDASNTVSAANNWFDNATGPIHDDDAATGDNVKVNGLVQYSPPSTQT